MASPKQTQNAVMNAGTPAKQEAFEITKEEIAQRAYALYLARGAADGHDLDDWLQAELELRTEKSAAA